MYLFIYLFICVFVSRLLAPLTTIQTWNLAHILPLTLSKNGFFSMKSPWRPLASKKCRVTWIFSISPRLPCDFFLQRIWISTLKIKGFICLISYVLIKYCVLLNSWWLLLINDVKYKVTTNQPTGAWLVAGKLTISRDKISRDSPPWAVLRDLCHSSQLQGYAYCLRFYSESLLHWHDKPNRT